MKGQKTLGNKFFWLNSKRRFIITSDKKLTEPIIIQLSYEFHICLENSTNMVIFQPLSVNARYIIQQYILRQNT